MLYLVSTPIGNLEDFTFRAINTLKHVDYILCEDTRRSSILLNHYAIKTPLKSYHQFSEASKEEQIIKDLEQGLSIALISDAGTPGISDPGERLVKRCREQQLPISPIPGACAAIAALVVSGLPTDSFQFIGFLPRKQQEKKQKLLEIFHQPHTTICYESPNRIINTLEEIATLHPEQPLCIARELTKKFEEFLYGKAEELLKRLKETKPKGEFCLLFAGNNELSKKWLTLTPEEHVQYLEETYALSQKDAIKLAAEQREIPKRDLYKEFCS